MLTFQMIFINYLQGVITKCLKPEAGVYELDGKIRSVISLYLRVMHNNVIALSTLSILW